MTDAVTSGPPCDQPGAEGLRKRRLRRQGKAKKIGACGARGRPKNRRLRRQGRRVSLTRRQGVFFLSRASKEAPELSHLR